MDIAPQKHNEKKGKHLLPREKRPRKNHCKKPSTEKVGKQVRSVIDTRLDKEKRHARKKKRTPHITTQPIYKAKKKSDRSSNYQDTKKNHSCPTTESPYPRYEKIMKPLPVYPRLPSIGKTEDILCGNDTLFQNVSSLC